MIIRTTAIWLLLLLIAIGAGGLRTTLLEPTIGEQRAHVIGTLVVVAIFASIIWGTASWISPTLDRWELLRTGILWLVATVVFEFGFGHYVMGHPWSKVLADYNLLAARLWVLVLLTVLLMPLVSGELQGRSTG